MAQQLRLNARLMAKMFVSLSFRVVRETTTHTEFIMRNATVKLRLL